VALLLVSSVAGAVPSYPLRYVFTAGEALLYQASTRAAVVVRTADDPLPQTAEVEVSSLVGYRVRSADRATGTARLAVYLKRLRLLTPGAEESDAVALQASRNSLCVQAGEQQASVVLRGGESLPAFIADCFGGYDPRALFQPSEVLVSPRGRVEPTQSAPWYRRLDDFPGGSPLAALAEGNLPWAWQLPGKAVELGQEWRQVRSVPSTATDGRLPLEVVYHLAPLTPDEPSNELLVRYEASDSEGSPAVSRRRVTGQLTFAAADGRLTGLEQVVEVTGPQTDGPGRISAKVRTVVTLSEVKPAS